MGKISNLQLAFLYISIIVGPGLITLPRSAVEGAGVDGIIAVLVGGVIFTALAFVFSKLAIKYKSETILEFSERLVGKYITRVIASIITLYFIAVLAIQIRTTGQNIKQFLLFNTPIEAIMICMLIVSAIAVSYGITSIARISLLYSLLTITSLLVVLVLSLQYFDIENLYPLFSNSPAKVFDTALNLAFYFLGFELLLFITPLLKRPENAPKVTVLTMIFITLIYILVVATSFGEFGIIPNQYIVFPTATLTKAVYISGFAERIDLLFMTFWILASFMSIAVIYFIESYAASKVVSQKNFSVFTYLSLPLVYILALLPQNAASVDNMTKIATYFAYFVIIPIFIILYILSFIRKRGESKSEA